MTTPIAEFKAVDVVFGNDSRKALQLLDTGKTRQEILEATGAIVGAVDCNLALREGEISVLMGLSGSGKSTLLRCLNGLNKAARGDVLVRDQEGNYIDPGRCSPEALRRLRTTRVAMVFQQFGLLPWRTVAENVGLGLELRGMPKSQREGIVREKLALVGLDIWADKYAHELSGGMQQRVGLARAFATDADILLMDEPFSALDPLIREHLQQELLDVQKRLKKTIVFVSHDLDEAIKLGQQISIMESGRIIQTGAPEDIVLHPKNDYVQRFVAHVNPVRVLRTASVMRPLPGIELPAPYRLRLDDHGDVVTLQHGDQTLSLHPSSELVGKALRQDLSPEKTAVMVPPETLLETLITLRARYPHPLLVCQGRHCLGVVTEHEIFQAMARRGA